MKIVGFPTMLPLVRRSKGYFTLVLKRINVDEKEYTANFSHALSKNGNVSPVRVSSVQNCKLGLLTILGPSIVYLFVCLFVCLFKVNSWATSCCEIIFFWHT